MLEEGVIVGLVVAETLGYRRAKFGRPPSRPKRIISSAVVSLVIHIGFHAAATVAPSPVTAIAFVLAGWTTFFIWWKWIGRAPEPWNFEEGEGGDDGPGGGGPGGGGGGGGPNQDRDDPGGGGREMDWDALEREMDDYLNRERDLVGAR